MAEVDADLGNVVVAGEDERSHEIVAAVAAGLEARNLENMSLFHTNSQSQSLIQIVFRKFEKEFAHFPDNVTLKSGIINHPWLPVTMTGLPRCSSMKESAEAV